MIYLAEGSGNYLLDCLEQVEDVLDLLPSPKPGQQYYLLFADALKTLSFATKLSSFQTRKVAPNRHPTHPLPSRMVVREIRLHEVSLPSKRDAHHE